MGIIKCVSGICAVMALSFVSVPSVAKDLPEQIDVLYVAAPFNLPAIVMKNHKMLEKEFDKEGVKINWINMRSGPRQAQSLASGSVQAATAMNFSSIVLANSNGNPIRIATGAARPSKLFALVCMPGKDPAKDAETKVAGPKGSALHQLLADYLSSKGKDPKTANLVSMNQPASLTALLASQVDCALLSGVQLQKAEEAGAKQLANAKDYTGVNLALVVSKDFAQQYPAAVSRMAKVQKEAVKKIQENPKEFISEGAKELGIPEGQAAHLASLYDYYYAVNENDLKQLKNTQEFLRKYGFIRQATPIEDMVLPVAKEK